MYTVAFMDLEKAHDCRLRSNILGCDESKVYGMGGKLVDEMVFM